MTSEKELIQKIRYEVDDFVKDVLRIAREHGHKIETSRNNILPQIDFGPKKLHEDHIRKLYPYALFGWIDISMLIDVVAPGRPCSHAPFRKIIEQLNKEKIAKKRGNK